MRRLLVLLAALGGASRLAAADPFTFKDGDRVVLIGSTLIEREQRSGYWELALTLHNKDRNVVFRNLGWSGDTIWGESRNVFDSPPKGFERLIEEAKKQKPTVIVICYGHNESFDGPAGVPKFTKGLERMLDALAPTKARFVLVSPTPFEKAGPLRDAEARNKDLALYRDAIRTVAAKRSSDFVDLFERVSLWSIARDSAGPATLTDNGLHLTPAGFEYTAPLLLAQGTAATAPGNEPLRAKIIEKNQLYFHQWRPQNVTYLFLFRKHEQGNNAVEIPQFDPLIEKAEKEIAELKKAIK